MASLNDSVRGLPVNAGDLAEALESLEARFARIEGVISQVVDALDNYPAQLGALFDERVRMAQDDLILADKTRAELDEVMADPDLGPVFKDRPARRDMLMHGWISNPDMPLRDVAARLKAEVFDSLTDAGVPEQKAEAVAETVADKIESATGAGDERARQEEADEASVMKSGGAVARGLLSKLAAGRGIKRTVEKGGMSKVKTSRAGSSSDFRRPGDKDWQK